MLRSVLLSRANCSLYLRCTHLASQRFLATSPPQPSTVKPSQAAASPVGTGISTVQGADNVPMIYVPTLLSRIKLKLGLQAELREPQKILYQAAAISYYMIGSSVDFEGIQRELQMTDVFASFGRIIFLHVWFLLVRYVQLGKSELKTTKRAVSIAVVTVYCEH